MIVKKVLCPERLRHVPEKFSWVDHRLIRDNHIQRCGPEALALYLLLVTVGDAEGLSYYSDATVGRLLSIDPPTVGGARRELVEAGLVAYQRPLYQVLSLDGVTETPARKGQAVPITEILRNMTGGER